MSSSQQNKNRKPTAEAIADDERQYAHSPISKEELNDKYPHRPRNHGKTLPFHELFISIFNPLEAHKKKKAGPSMARKKVGPHGPNNLPPHEERRNIIVRFMSRWRSQVGDDFFPALRLIIPEKDRDRAMYGLKEASIAKLIIKVLNLSKDSDDGYNLANWKLPARGPPSANSGDFPGRCYEVLSRRPMRQRVGDMSIGEVNELLDKLALAQKEENQLPIFREFYQRMNAEELLWLVRMILRQMKIGASEKTFLNLWHPDGEALFNVSSSLRRVCWELTDPTITLEADETGVELMSCFQPQLAQFMPNSFQKLVDKMCPQGPGIKDQEFWIEEKLDGERIQMHMEENDDAPGGYRFSWWSRKGKDYTYLYGNSFGGDNSALTRHMKNAFDPRVSSIILDGEMITWDPITNKIVAFGTLKTAAISGKNDPFSDTAARPVFKVFDCGGFNADDYATIRHQTEGKWIKWDAKSPPTEFIELAGSHQERERPDVWIKPEDSIVVEVKAASVGVSDSFRTNFTLRFPRFKRLRPDKDWKSALSIEEFMELKAKVEGGGDDEFEVEKKKRDSHRVKRQKIIAGTADYGKSAYAGPHTDVFKGMKFCVLSEMIHPVKKSKVEIERIIKNNGGQISQSPNGKEDIVIIADKRVVKAASLIKIGKTSIVKPIWVLDAVEQMEKDAKLGGPRYVLPFEKDQYMLHITEGDEEEIEGNTDQHGDSYARDVKSDELRKIFETMGDIEHDDEETGFDADALLAELEENGKGLGLDKMKSWMFRGCKGVFVVGEKIHDDLRLEMNHFEFGRGVALEMGDLKVEADKGGVTHIIFADDMEGKARDIRKEFGRSGSKPHLVSWRWIRDAWEEGEGKLDEKEYLIKG
ncbi:hypothetical protein EYC80_008834 [Monilinia laxa]|uniref:DNA ligase 4 n=1 Tax=Monilinia laxa TaxID=61186 RepID=A0A5N6K1J4_MONLA|nr:hypothetical protein EYC80_008834 [Monilinia laxa]